MTGRATTDFEALAEFVRELVNIEDRVAQGARRQMQPVHDDSRTRETLPSAGAPTAPTVNARAKAKVDDPRPSDAGRYSVITPSRRRRRITS